MKKLTLTLTIALLALLAPAQLTNLVSVDLTTLRTNTTSSSGVLFVPGQFTNGYVAVKTNNITQGDPIPTAFAKLGTNDQILATVINALLTNTPAFVATNYTVTASTNTTLGLPVGSLALDTNYLYLVVGTNNWRRLAWLTNTW